MLFEGIGFGYPTGVAGEVVFNTGMVGYTESLTDPSYHGQILCMTYPLIGNYGVPSYDIKDKYGLPKFFESDKIQSLGLVIHQLSDISSHWSASKTLEEWMFEEKIPGIYGVDTREITKILRMKGVMMGALIVSDKEVTIKELEEKIKNDYYEGKNFMGEVSTHVPLEYGAENTKTIVLLDTGTKYSIIRNLLDLKFRIIRLPWDTKFDELIKYNPVGVVISNGPGDPKVCNSTIDTAKKLIESSTPTLGICLGNQILALASGADTYKLQFGHRGQNKSCINTHTNQSYITSQNHGYGIDEKSLTNTDFDVWFHNPDDNTVEGIVHKNKPLIAVQFHPEASPGPLDCKFVFTEFSKLINENKIEKKVKI